MLIDIEIGRIDTVMFTELSRLSRSLKDFLNIFEFVRRHNCDLICLKTNIDTTSPYQELVTKILMVFAEFEREMTSRRTSLNTYERSKWDLANGGLTILGYRRDQKRKGYLIVDEKESEVVQAIFKTYIKERSIRRTTDMIRECYEGLTPKLKKIAPSKVYGILTNKAYIGIRVINKRDKAEYEEVKAVWEPIIEKELFQKAQTILQENRDRYHAK
jgi:DNA invertase Pin-like site-specific DNA recombinase